MSRQLILMIFIMTLLMGLLLSAVFTWQAQGFHEGFLGAWMLKFVTTYLVVLPTVVVVSPIADRLSRFLSSHLDRVLGTPVNSRKSHSSTKDHAL